MRSALMDSESLSRQIVEIARGLEHETGAQATMDLTVRLAVDTVPHAQHAAITIARKGQGPQTQAATSALIHRIDEIQLELNEGPCVSAIFDQELISVPDLHDETRWAGWAGQVLQEAAIGSMLCFRLYTTAQRVGALNLFAAAPRAFNRDDIEAGTLVAAHAAIAIAMAQQLEHVEVGLDSRSTVGQAQGILMERYDIDAIRAFAVLRRISSRANRKLIDVASELVRTRDLPEAD
jgi:GAF domain-containing protein